MMLAAGRNRHLLWLPLYAEDIKVSVDFKAAQRKIAAGISTVTRYCSGRRPAPFQKMWQRIFGTGKQPPSIDSAKYFTPDTNRAPSPQGILPRPKVKGGPDRGLGWEGMFGQPWPKQNDGMGPTKDTNPLGMMEEKLTAEVTKYGDFAQLTYPNFIHFGKGNPQIEDPSCLLPEAHKQSHSPAKKPSWIDKASPIFQYTIPEDDRFYLEATSGVYPGEFEDDNLLRRNLSWILGKVYGGTDNAPQSRNWIGYVAVSPQITKAEDPNRVGERDLVVVFRGTQAKTEWVSDVIAGMVKWSESQTTGPDVRVERGFETIYRRFDSTPGNTISIQGQVHVAVRTLLAKYGNEPREGAITSITTTGHSLGGALASLCAFDLAWSKIGRLGDQQSGDLIPVTAFTFEAPRVGNKAFADVFRTQHSGEKDDPESNPLQSYVPLKSLRIINTPDIVPKEPCWPFSMHYLYPPLWWKAIRFLFGSLLGLLSHDAGHDNSMGYHHGGQEYKVNTEPIWDWPGPPITSYKNWWWPPKGFGWWLSRIGEMHSLQLPLYLIDPIRGMRTEKESPTAMQNGHATHHSHGGST